MYKKLLIASVLLMSSIVFANSKVKEKDVKEQTSKKIIALECCTATLTYNGTIVDTETVCGFITMGDNCNVAAHNLLVRNPNTGLNDPLGH